MNTDGNANGVYLSATGHWSNDGIWAKTLNGSGSGNIRINYVVIRSQHSVSHCKTYTGSKVLNFNNLSYATLWSDTDFKQQFGRSFNSATDSISIMNGDANSADRIAIGVNYYPKNKQILAVILNVYNGNVRINYQVVLVQYSVSPTGFTCLQGSIASGTYCAYTRIGHLIFVCMNDMPSMGTKGYLPEGYRPPTDIIGFGYIRGTNTSGQILVNSAGEVATWCTTNSTQYFSGSVCFVVEQHSVSQDADWVALNQFIKYKKTGNIGTVTGTSSGGFGFGGNDKYGTVGTLPSKYCPSIDIPFVFHSMGGSSYNKSALIDHNGDIKLYDRGNYINYWGFCVSYQIQYSVSQVPKIYIGSLVKQSSDTSVCMFTNDEFISKFGRSFNHTADFIAVISGDNNNIPVHVEGVQLDPNNKKVWAVFDRVWNSSIRLNYIVVLA